MSDAAARRYYEAWLYWSARDEARWIMDAWRISVDLWLDGIGDDPGAAPNGLIPELAALPTTPRMTLEHNARRRLEEVLLWWDCEGWRSVLPVVSTRRDEQVLAHELLTSWLSIALEDNPVRRDELQGYLNAELEALRD